MAPFQTAHLAREVAALSRVKPKGCRTDPRRNFITVLLLRHSAVLSLAIGDVRRFPAGIGIGRATSNVVSLSSGT